MTQLSEKDHKALMSDMKSFDEQMPCIGIFWYDQKSHALCDVNNDKIEFSILNIAFKQGQTEVRFRYAEREQCLRRLAANSQLSIGHGWSGDMPK